MNEKSINTLIVAVRHINGMLQLLDETKLKPETTIGELQDRFEEIYHVSPRSKDFFFYNQHQFLTSLLAYVCLPKETFYAQLPEMALSDLDEKWGLKNVLLPITLKEVIRHLRNAISHGHVEISKELIFTFQDKTTTIILNHVAMHKFCQALAWWCLTKDVDLKNL